MLYAYTCICQSQVKFGAFAPYNSPIIPWHVIDMLNDNCFCATWTPGPDSG